MTGSLADYIRQHYSTDGIEVEGVGQGRVRLRMPPDFSDISSLACNLAVEFDATLDLTVDDTSGTSVIFEVYTPQKTSRHDAMDEQATDSADPDVIQKAVSSKHVMCKTVIMQVCFAFVVMLLSVFATSVMPVLSPKAT